MALGMLMNKPNNQQQQPGSTGFTGLAQSLLGGGNMSGAMGQQQGQQQGLSGQLGGLFGSNKPYGQQQPQNMSQQNQQYGGMQNQQQQGGFLNTLLSGLHGTVSFDFHWCEAHAYINLNIVESTTAATTGIWV